MDERILTAIDANINRATEGLRVCEDIFRFIIRDEVSEKFKELRHRIVALIKFIPRSDLLHSRDVESDLQKFFDTDSEKNRQNIGDLFSANIKRAQEALRVLEEFSKMDFPELSIKFQQLRFDAYSLEKNSYPLIQASCCKN
ncbi:MAG TPA: thiamine-phosphate pyrophosphorylase [Spirochaetota bacterium]|nr:thiamine-phosphate pyrophosphorylase [Spirochaetota bacterium]HON16770.1 thiamine-phosphate pyrophosphorylase [Spirochaetota bacterium]HPP95574.1 thiamine-phosphate pyrophosphorylase [Spirochaetota bacterium]